MRRYTLVNFNNQFPTEASCLAYLYRARWPHGAPCGPCGKNTVHYPETGRQTYECTTCRSKVSPTANTIFHKSPTPLRSWFYAIYLMASTRTGISAKHLQRELGVTYKTAWRMFHEIRRLMAENPTDMGPTLEADETYIGGKRKGYTFRYNRRGQAEPMFLSLLARAPALLKAA